MKNLPIGIQSFKKLIDRNSVYVDKTQLIHQLATMDGGYYFFSRPRRFGKSLLISTIKELFIGNQPLFKGLWIDQKDASGKPRWDWTQVHPVIHLSFDSIDYKFQTLEESIHYELSYYAKNYGVKLTQKGISTRFKELLEKLARKHGRVVLLIDEYDKPILDYLEKKKREQAYSNRDVLRDFYSILKNSDEYLHFVFITGISKFTKVSLFSHLNNLSDITMAEDYATLAGYTQEEIETYFEDYLAVCGKKLNLNREELLQDMKEWYDGFSWDGEHRLYNPFGTLNFFRNKKFKNFWFSTGSPQFLIELMREMQLYNVENIKINEVLFDKFDLDNIDLVSLLFQTGYLTVKGLGKLEGDYILDYPNREVRDSMYQFLIDDLSRNHHRTNTRLTIYEMHEAFITGDLEQVRLILDGILRDLPPETHLNQTEGLFHGLVHVIFNYLGVFLQSEVASSLGYADAVVHTPTDVYIFEFKFNKSAAKALAQIHKKNYAAKYRASGKRITAIGVNFSTGKRTIDEWLEEKLP